MNKKILIVSLFATLMLLVPINSVVGIMNEKIIPTNIGICNNFLNELSIHKPILISEVDSLFKQLPNPTNHLAWKSMTSDPSAGWLAYDDFYQISGSICDIHWWGQCLIYLGGDWYSRDPTGMVFRIEFYDDNNGMPGTLLYTYDDLTPPIVETGILYDYGNGLRFFELYYFETVLDPCVEMSNGWISIQSTYVPSGGWFMWINSDDGNNKMVNRRIDWYIQDWDVSFILTDSELGNPNLECEGELNWANIRPRVTVTGDFVVRNNGDVDSILNWKIDSYPSWGTWTFNPHGGVLTTDMDWFTVDVEVKAPNTPDFYTGTITLANSENPTNSCEIPVTLHVKAKNKNIQFQNLITNHPNLFPILHRLLSL